MSAASIADAHLRLRIPGSPMHPYSQKADLKVGLYVPNENQNLYRRKVNFVMPEMPLPHGQSIEPLAGRAVARTRT
jgi:hypothetical protein